MFMPRVRFCSTYLSVHDLHTHTCTCMFTYTHTSILLQPFSKDDATTTSAGAPKAVAEVYTDVETDSDAPFTSDSDTDDDSMCTGIHADLATIVLAAFSMAAWWVFFFEFGCPVDV